MQTVLVVLTVLVSILLIIVVLVQKSKGGGLASNFAGSNQIMGVRRTNDFIEKTTWTLAIIILFLSVIASLIAPDAQQLNPADQQRYDMTTPAQTTQDVAPSFDTNAEAPAAAAEAE